MYTFGREKAEFSPSAMAMLIAGLALMMTAMLIYIYPSIRATSLMYEYSERYRGLLELRELNKKMKLEVSTLRSYDFIENRALNKLGFVFPAPDQVVIIEKKE